MNSFEERRLFQKILFGITSNATTGNATTGNATEQTAQDSLDSKIWTLDETIGRANPQFVCTCGFRIRRKGKNWRVDLENHRRSHIQCRTRCSLGDVHPNEKEALDHMADAPSSLDGKSTEYLCPRCDKGHDVFGHLEVHVMNRHPNICLLCFKDRNRGHKLRCLMTSFLVIDENGKDLLAEENIDRLIKMNNSREMKSSRKRGHVCGDSQGPPKRACMAEIEDTIKKTGLSNQCGSTNMDLAKHQQISTKMQIEPNETKEQLSPRKPLAKPRSTKKRPKAPRRQGDSPQSCGTNPPLRKCEMHFCEFGGNEEEVYRHFKICHDHHFSQSIKAQKRN